MTFWHEYGFSRLVIASCTFVGSMLFFEDHIVLVCFVHSLCLQLSERQPFLYSSSSTTEVGFRIKKSPTYQAYHGLRGCFSNWSTMSLSNCAVLIKFPSLLDNLFLSVAFCARAFWFQFKRLVLIDWLFRVETQKMFWQLCNLPSARLNVYSEQICDTYSPSWVLQGYYSFWTWIFKFKVNACTSSRSGWFRHLPPHRMRKWNMFHWRIWLSHILKDILPLGFLSQSTWCLCCSISELSRLQRYFHNGPLDPKCRSLVRWEGFDDTWILQYLINVIVNKCNNHISGFRGLTSCRTWGFSSL